MTDQRDALRHIQLVLRNIVVAQRRRWRMRRQLKMSRQRTTRWRLQLFPHPLHRRSILSTGQLRDEHGLQRVHGTANVPIAHLLVEDKTEAVAPLAILPSRRKCVELGLDAVLLRAELESSGQGQHANAMTVERIVRHVLRVVRQSFALVVPVQRRTVQVVA